MRRVFRGKLAPFLFAGQADLARVDRADTHLERWRIGLETEVARGRVEEKRIGGTRVQVHSRRRAPFLQALSLEGRGQAVGPPVNVPVVEELAVAPIASEQLAAVVDDDVPLEAERS